MTHHLIKRARAARWLHLVKAAQTISVGEQSKNESQSAAARSSAVAMGMTPAAGAVNPPAKPVDNAPGIPAPGIV